jgi:CrcB protein
MELALVCLAGAIGTGARHLTQVALHAHFGSVFPVGTLVVNVVGSLLMGVVFQLSVHDQRIPEMARLTLAVGFLGGFTTYSSFNQELLEMLRGGREAAAALYVGVTGASGLAAGFLGMRAARLMALWVS